MESAQGMQIFRLTVSRTTSPAYIFPKSRNDREIPLTNSDNNSKNPTKIITIGVRTEMIKSKGFLTLGP